MSLLINEDTTAFHVNGRHPASRRARNRNSHAVALFGLLASPLATSAALAASQGQLAILPTSFIGEAATLALAFAAPALCAGGYIVLKRIAKRTGAPVLVGIGVVATAVGGLALSLGNRIDFLATLTPS
jgi:hypothetical protein